jgi:hypothetical protein
LKGNGSPSRAMMRFLSSVAGVAVGAGAVVGSGTVTAWPRESKRSDVAM